MHTCNVCSLLTSSRICALLTSLKLLLICFNATKAMDAVKEADMQASKGGCRIVVG